MRKCSMFSRIRSSNPSLAEPSHKEGRNDVFAGALQHPTHLESRPCSAAPSPCMCADAESVCETEPPRRLSHPEGLRLSSYIYFLYNICTCSIHIYFLYNVCTCSIHKPHSNTLFRRPQTCTGAIWLSASRTRRCKCPSHSCCNHHCSIYVNSCQLLGWIYWRPQPLPLPVSFHSPLPAPLLALVTFYRYIVCARCVISSILYIICFLLFVIYIILCVSSLLLLALYSFESSMVK